MRYPVRQRCGFRLRSGSLCVRPAGHPQQHRSKTKCGVYRVDAKQVPLPDRPACRTRGGCCLHPSARDLALTIAAENGTVTVADVALAKRCSYRAAGSALCDAMRAGQIVRVGRGRYALPPPAQRALGGKL